MVAAFRRYLAGEDRRCCSCLRRANSSILSNATAVCQPCNYRQKLRNFFNGFIGSCCSEVRSLSARGLWHGAEVIALSSKRRSTGKSLPVAAGSLRGLESLGTIATPLFQFAVRYFDEPQHTFGSGNRYAAEKAAILLLEERNQSWRRKTTRTGFLRPEKSLGNFPKGPTRKRINATSLERHLNRRLSENLSKQPPQATTVHQCIGQTAVVVAKSSEAFRTFAPELVPKPGH